MSEPNKITNPFPGLRPFETSEYGLFFGRDGQSDALIERLQRSHFLAVVGTSGSGKSSLVRAGLLPALRGGMMAGAGSGWRIAIMRPGSDPIGNLAAALAVSDVLLEAGGGLPPAEAEAVIEATLRRGSLGLVDAARQARLAEHEKLLVVVDQFEELFRFRAARAQSSTGDDASAFVKLLLEGAQQSELSIYVVPTMRSDFLGDCAQFQGLPEAINDGQYLIPRMTRDERRFAITGPVGVKRCKITEPLVNRLMNDVGDNPDQLPILQHALMRTWDYWIDHRHDGEAIGLEHYEAIGTMSAALSKHADEAWGELDERGRLVAEKLFKALTERGADNREIRRPTSLEDICAIADATVAEVTTAINVFRAEGRSFLMPPATVTLKPKTVIDISHESLIRNWQRLKDWVNEEAQSARIYRRLAEAAVLHREGSEGLAQDPGLQIALDWRERTCPNAAWGKHYHPEFEAAVAYLEASRAARDAAVAERERERQQQIERERRELEQTQLYAAQQAASARRMRKLSAGMAVVIVLALLTAGYALHAKVEAKISQKETEAALQRNGLIRKGLEALGRDHSEEALKSFDCLSQNLQALLPNAPHLAPWTKGPCEESATSESGQLEVQLAWAYTNLGSTFSSIADHLPPDEAPKTTPPPDDASNTAPKEATTKADEVSQKILYSRALDAYEHAVRILETLVRDGKVRDEAPDLLNAYRGVAHAYHSVALTGYEPPPFVHIETIPADAYFFLKAEETFQNLLRIQERHLDKDPADAAVEHVNLARLYRDMRHDTEAQENFQKAAELWEKSARLQVGSGDVSEEDSSNQEIAVLRELAEFQSNLGNFSDAEKAYDRVIDIQENYDISRAQDVADSYSELGQIYQSENKVDKARAAFQLASILPQAALRSRRHDDERLCLDMFKLAPVYFKLNRYVQARQAYDIAIGKGTCLEEKKAEAEGLLNRALGQLANRHDGDPARIWEDEDGIYQTLFSLLPEGNEADQLVTRRLNNMARRFGEVSKQPASVQDEPRFTAAYGATLYDIGFIYKDKQGDQAETSYRLAFNALSLVQKSTDPDVLSHYASLLEVYEALLVAQQKPDEAAKVKEAAKDLLAKEAELEKNK